MLEQNPNYQNVITQDFYVPLGPWKARSPNEVTMSMLMREDITRILHAFKPLLLAQGRDAMELDVAVENATHEMRDLHIRGLIQWKYTTAIRTENEWVERLERPAPIP